MHKATNVGRWGGEEDVFKWDDGPTMRTIYVGR